MRLFSRKRDDDDEPVDPNERSPELGIKFKDLAVLGQLMKAGADLTQPRHVVFYSYAPSEEVAHALKADIEEGEYTAEVRDPLPQQPDQWSVVAETHTVTSPDFVRDADNFFQELADRHGADYDGWEASV